MKALIVISISLTCMGCSTTGLFSDTGYALIANYTEPVNATDHKDSNKVGRACTANYLGFAAVGDGSIEAARQDGKITEVTAVDKEFFRILGLYGRVCTVARGR